jgi:hypothetical protein
VRQRGADQQERRLEHEGDEAAEVGRIEVLDGADPLDAGIVDQDVAIQADGLE